MRNLLFVLAMASFSLLQAGTAVYLNEDAPLEDRVEDALSRMTL